MVIKSLMKTLRNYIFLIYSKVFFNVHSNILKCMIVKCGIVNLDHL